MRNQRTYCLAFMIVATGAAHIVLAQPTASPQGPRHLAIVPSPNPSPVGLRVTRIGGDGTNCMTYYVLPNGRLSVYPTYLSLGPGQVVVVSDAEITPNTEVTVEEEFLVLPPLVECCYSLSHAGCADPLCNDIVCQSDPYCCESRWDHFCAAAAAANCPHLACADSAPTPGGATNAILRQWGDIDGNNQVNFLDISTLVSCFRHVAGAPLVACDIWPCVPDGINNFLDISQGVGAFKGFPFPCSDPCNHACSQTGGLGCNDPLVEACVCGPDDWCCTTAWDDVCVNEVVGYGCDGAAHGCCETGGPGCNDPLVAACVCEARPECCAGPHGWDETCVAAVQWEGCGFCTLNPHSCCEAGEPGCDDVTIADCVCAVEPNCCDEAWNDTCIEIAVDDCGTCLIGDGGCACESFTFNDKTILRDKALKAGHELAAGGTVQRVTIAFEVAGTLTCTEGPNNKQCEGTINASVDGTTAFSTHNIEEDSEKIDRVATASDPIPRGGTEPDGKVSEKCGKSKEKTAAFKYQIDLTPPAVPIIGTIKIKVELVCDGVTSERVLTFQFDTRNAPGESDNLDNDQSDLDGDGLNGAKEGQRTTGDDDVDTDGDGKSEGPIDLDGDGEADNDRFPRDKKKQ